MRLYSAAPTPAAPATAAPTPTTSALAEPVRPPEPVVLSDLGGGDISEPVLHDGGDTGAYVNEDEDEFVGSQYHNTTKSDFTKEQLRYYSVVRDVTGNEICSVLLNHQSFDSFDEKKPEELGVHVVHNTDDLGKVMEGFQPCDCNYNTVVGPYTLTGAFYQKHTTYGLLYRLSVSPSAVGDLEPQTRHLIQTKCLSNNGHNCISLRDNISTLLESIDSTFGTL